MAHKQRSHDQILEHRARIAELHNQGISNQDIAEELGVSKYVICRDLAAIRANWQESALANLDEAKKRELDKINLIEAEAWEQWEKSKEPRTSKSVTQGDTVNKKSVKEEERGGDPRYLATIQWCSEMRAKILGLIVNKVDHTSQGKRLGAIELVEVRSAADRDQQQTVLH